jgi:hypothetical protein
MEVCKNVDTYVKVCTAELENDLKEALTQKEAALLESETLRAELALKDVKIAELERKLQ